MLFNLSFGKSVYLLIIVGLAVYSKTLFNGFVWDDSPHILENPLVKYFKISQIFTSGAFFPDSDSFLSFYYKPLMPLIFASIYKVFSESPFGYHFLQILLHIANSIVLLVFYKRYFKLSFAFFLALIFLVHPINFEAAGYISALQDTLFLFFGLISLLLLTDDQGKRDWTYRRYLLVGGTFFLSILSKETGFIFAGVGILYLVLFKLGRLKIYLYTLGFFSLFYFLFRFVAAGSRYGYLNESAISKIAVFERLISVPSIVLYYLKTFVLPKDLFIDQQWIIRKATLVNFYFPILILATVGIIIFYLVHKAVKGNKHDFKLLIFFGTWALMGIFVHTHLLTALDMTVADRWFYFAIAGLLAFLGILIANIRLKFLNRRFSLYFLKALGILVLVSLSARTVVRSFDWKDNLTLYSHDLKYAQDNYQLENKYAASLLKSNDLANGEIHLRRVLLYNPNYAPAYVNLGYVYEKSGDFEKAKEYYLKSVEVGDGSSILSLNKALGALARIELFYNNNPSAARDLAQKGLGKFAQDTYLMKILALSEYSLGNRVGALEIINKAYQLNRSDEIWEVKIGIEKGLPLELTKE